MRRANYRGRPVAFPLGAPLLAASLSLAALLAALDAWVSLDLIGPGAGRWIAYVAGVALLGLLDDLIADTGPEAPRGWRGHAGAALDGELTSGAIKALGTVALAAWASSGLPGGTSERLVDTGILVLATNLGNLLDLRPGRAEKALVLVLAGVCVGYRTVAPLELLAVFLAPVFVGAWLTLRERAMLGDTGAHLVGALIGITVVTTLSFPAACAALAVLAAITIFGEFRSISSAIERLPLVKQLDSLGRVR